VAFDTVAGRLSGVMAGDKLVTVDMGQPGLGLDQIPLAEEMDTVGSSCRSARSTRRWSTRQAASRWAIRTWCSSSTPR
jgi:diaminopimelate epimerase